MHQAIKDGLEEYLAGAADPECRDRIEAHLKDCSECRLEVDSMLEISDLFVTLRSEEVPAPSPSFYAGLSQRIERTEQRSIWSAFLLPAFGRQIAFASLLILATLGTVLLSLENEYGVTPNPETILAVEREMPSPLADPSLDRDRDQMLMTLVSHK